MGKIYKTAQGKSLDLEQLKLRNELIPAVGNMRVNARGDQLGPGGKVVKSREEMLDQHYKTNVSKRRSSAEPDVIPTRAGKVSTVETKQKFSPSSIEVDTISSVAKESNVVDDEFVDPDVKLPETDPVTGIAAGEKSIKGGLARAVAKTRDYEDSKNKPKRL